MGIKPDGGIFLVHSRDCVLLGNINELKSLLCELVCICVCLYLFGMCIFYRYVCMRVCMHSCMCVRVGGGGGGEGVFTTKRGKRLAM